MDYIDFSHGGDVYEVEEKHRSGLIDFSANINPLGLPLRVRKGIHKNLDTILHYPDPKARNVVRGISKYWKIDKRNILIGNGSIELIYLIVSAYKPRTVLIPVPTFSEYERAAKNVSSRIRFSKLNEGENFRLNLSGLNKPDVFFVCNPNNPTGNLILKKGQAIESLANKLVVVDEAFMDFLPNQRGYSYIRQAVRNRKIAVLRTLTKFFALPGLRIGYVVAHRDVIGSLEQHQPPWSTSSLAQIAAEEILSEKAYGKKTYKLIGKERRFLFRELGNIRGLRPYPSVTNFILIKIEKAGVTSKSLKKALIKKGVLVRDCSNFRNLNSRYIRVAVRSRKENLRLLAAMREAL